MSRICRFVGSSSTNFFIDLCEENDPLNHSIRNSNRWETTGRPGRLIFMGTTYFETYLQALESVIDHHGILGENFLILPPNPNYRYQATPRNALTFAKMGVDGVHYSILLVNGAVTDESPVIHVSPMDSEPYAVLGETFLSYLATACGVSIHEMESIFEEERRGGEKLVPFLKANFDDERCYDDTRLNELDRLSRLRNCRLSSIIEKGPT